MVRFKAVIQKFGEMGEKTGWFYISIPQNLAEEIKPGQKKSFRVKGRLDKVAIAQVAVLPVGNGEFILPLKLSLRKTLRKNKGAELTIVLEEDIEPLKVFSELTDCLKDSPLAEKIFTSLPHSHQMYYSNWILFAKSPQTRARRIMCTILGMERKLSFAEILKLNAQFRC